MENLSLKLPIPIRDGQNSYTGITLRGINTGVIADTRKSVESGNTYRALHTFVTGITESLEKDGPEKIEDRSVLRVLLWRIPWDSAFYAMTMALLQGEDDGVDGIYRCPRCGKTVICELNSETKYDNRDHIRDLEVLYCPAEVKNFSLELPEVLKIGKSDADHYMEITKMVFEYPTLDQCARASDRIGEDDETRLQLAILVESMVDVECTQGTETDFEKFKRRWGMTVMERLMKQQLRDLLRSCHAWGMQTRVEKRCRSCKKVFNVEINTSNFFASALR